MFKGFKTIYFQSFMRLILTCRHVLDIQNRWRCICSYCFKVIEYFFCHICIKMLEKCFQYFLLRGHDDMGILATRNPNMLVTWADVQAHVVNRHGVVCICCAWTEDLTQPAVRSSDIVPHEGENCGWSDDRCHYRNLQLLVNAMVLIAKTLTQHSVRLETWKQTLLLLIETWVLHELCWMGSHQSRFLK